MNDLVAIDGTEANHQFWDSVEDPTIMLDYVPVVGDLVNEAQAFGEGDWVGGLLHGATAVANTATTIAAATTDPIGTLMSSCASFLLDYMPPLPQMLDALAGNPALVQSIGETWGNISRALTERASQLQAELDETLGNWSGAAAKAYQARMEFLIGMTQALSIGAMGIGSGMAIASVVVDFVRSEVRDLIADLVGKLISYVIQMGATLGTALPAVIGEATIAIADKVTDVAQWSDDLVKAIESGVKLLNQLKGTIDSIISNLEDVGTPASAGGGGGGGGGW